MRMFRALSLAVAMQFKFNFQFLHKVSILADF